MAATCAISVGRSVISLEIAMRTTVPGTITRVAAVHATSAERQVTLHAIVATVMMIITLEKLAIAVGATTIFNVNVRRLNKNATTVVNSDTVAEVVIERKVPKSAIIVDRKVISAEIVQRLARDDEKNTMEIYPHVLSVLEKKSVRECEKPFCTKNLYFVLK